MPDPFQSYLRVYEPLRVFDGPSGAPVRAALARGPVPPEQAARREQERCLRATLRSRLLPGDRADGGPRHEPVVDVLVLDRPGEPLVCPLDTRPRAAAAVLVFLAEQPPLLRSAALPVPERVARHRAQAALAEIGDGAAHVVSATWTVPLPWFALVDAEQRLLHLAGHRRVSWQVPIGTALLRAARAEAVVRTALGDAGPAEVLAETGGWLQQFDRSSVVELDYGGMAALLGDDALRADRSVELVQESLRALRDGDPERAGSCYAQLREFWGAVAARRHQG